MAVEREKVLASLALKRIPPDLCWGTPTEFIKSLINILTVTLDVNSNTDFVVIGNQIPSEDDKGRLWVRRLNNGSFAGFYLFINGTWQRVYNRRNDEIIWMFGDSREIPDGFELIDASSQVPTNVKNHITKQYLVNTSVVGAGTVYSYFAVRYIGV